MKNVLITTHKEMERVIKQMEDIRDDIYTNRNLTFFDQITNGLITLGLALYILITCVVFIIAVPVVIVAGLVRKLFIKIKGIF